MSHLVKQTFWTVYLLAEVTHKYTQIYEESETNIKHLRDTGQTKTV